MSPWLVVLGLVAITQLAAQPGKNPLRGNPSAAQKGAALFDAKCAGCHGKEARGGEAPDRFRTVDVTLKDGRGISGTLKNEDNFSLQIMKPDGEYALIDRAEVARQDLRDRSMMPADYGRKLTGAQLQDLLAFLDRQRAP